MRTLFRNRKELYIWSRVISYLFSFVVYLIHKQLTDYYDRFGVGPIRLMAESSEAASNFYQFKARDIDGKEVDLSRYFSSHVHVLVNMFYSIISGTRVRSALSSTLPPDEARPRPTILSWSSCMSSTTRYSCQRQWYFWDSHHIFSFPDWE